MTDSTAPSPPHVPPAPARAFSEWRGWPIVLICASLAAVTARMWDAPPLRSANDRSRWSTVWAITERNTYQIDEIRKPGWDSIDIVRHDGHFYSSKPPLLPRLVAEIYRPLRKITGWNLLRNTERVTRTILLLINILPMGLALWTFSRFVQRYSLHPGGALFVIACACWGTMLLPYLTVFNNHTIAATCFFFSLPLLAGILLENKQAAWRYAACGLLTAFGVCNELPAALFGVITFGLLFRSNPLRTLQWFVPAALIPLSLFFITNYHATGGFKPFYAYYGTEKYNFIHEGVPSYWMDPKGIDRPRDSTLTYLFHCTFGHHGIFSLTPIWLLAAAGWCLPRFWRQSPLRQFSLVSLVLTVVTLGFYLTKTENYNYSGVTVALRWMLWLTPFWLTAMIPVLNAAFHRSGMRVLSLTLLSVSVFSAWYPANAPWAQNWLYRWLESAGKIDYSDPPPKFQREHYSWISQLPEGPIQPDYWIEFSSAATNGELEILRLADAGPGDTDERLISVTWTHHGRPPETDVYRLNAAAFRDGQPVTDFLIGREDGNSLTEFDRRFFQGVPGNRRYVSSRIRFEKSPLRTDAFRCHVGYAHAKVTGEDGIERQFIRDVWYCDELPFGLLKWEDRILNAANRSFLGRRHWLVRAAGMVPSDQKSGSD